MRRAATIAAAAALAVAGCGYRLAQRYVATGGAERIHVGTFENRSTEPALGAAVTTALRDELARRGADAGDDAQAFLDGEVRAGTPTPSSPGAETWRIAVEVRARLVTRGGAAVERTVRRETDFLTGAGGADALETEGRRALALRRLADEAARELLRSFEGP